MIYVIDIETVPAFEELDAERKKIVLNNCADEEAITKAKDAAGLNPFTGKICCIGVYELESGTGTALYIDDRAKVTEMLDGKTVTLVPCKDEADLLKRFWFALDKRTSAIKKFITFNGRAFDMPYIMLRSALLDQPCQFDLMAGTKWAQTVKTGSRSIPHIDLAEVLTFSNASYNNSGPLRKWSLDMYTRSFGIKSPKSEGIAGDSVAGLFAEGKSDQIARYCLRDVIATGELYLKITKHLWID